MRIAVWKTGHAIADQVADYVARSLEKSGQEVSIQRTSKVGDVAAFDMHIAYGILRGTTDVFRECTKAGLPWFHIDRGYFHPGHFDGQYRISLCGTQHVYDLNNFTAEYPEVSNVIRIPSQEDYHLIVPPSDAVCEFFGIDRKCWILSKSSRHSVVRNKDCTTPLKDHLKGCSKLVTFNSTSAIQALKLGIQVESDPEHSIIGAFQKTLDFPIHTDKESIRKLFGIMSNLQMTLSDMSNGKLWPLMKRLTCLSDTTAENLSLPMSQPIA